MAYEDRRPADDVEAAVAQEVHNTRIISTRINTHGMVPTLMPAIAGHTYIPVVE